MLAFKTIPPPSRWFVGIFLEPLTRTNRWNTQRLCYPPFQDGIDGTATVISRRRWNMMVSQQHHLATYALGLHRSIGGQGTWVDMGKGERPGDAIGVAAYIWKLSHDKFTT